jgi:hypothetical protein
MMNAYVQLKMNTVISQYMEQQIVKKKNYPTHLPNQNPPSWEKKHANTFATR